MKAIFLLVLCLVTACFHADAQKTYVDTSARPTIFKWAFLNDSTIEHPQFYTKFYTKFYTVEWVKIKMESGKQRKVFKSHTACFCECPDSVRVVPAFHGIIFEELAVNRIQFFGYDANRFARKLRS